MLHRTHLRELAVKTLKSNKELKKIVGENIYDSKTSPFVKQKLPGINIVTSTQNGTSRSQNTISLANSLKLNIEIYVQVADGWQAEADMIAEIVEKTLLRNQDFIKNFSELQNYDVENSIYDQGAQPIVVQILSFNLSFFEDYNLTIEEDLSQINIGIDVIDPIADPSPGPDGRIEFDMQINP